MLDPIARLTAARFDGPQALYTTAVRLLSERPAVPDDLAGLVVQLRNDHEDCSFHPPIPTVFSEAADAIEALAAENARLAASEPQCAAVKPLEWEHVTLTQTWQAKSIFGEYAVGFDDGWWAQLDGHANWEWAAPDDPRTYHGPDAAKAAAQADYEARVLSAITIRAEAEVRAEGREAGVRDGLREALLIATSQEVRCAEWVVAGNGNPVASEQCAQIASDILAKLEGGAA